MENEQMRMQLLLCQYKWALVHLYCAIYLDDEELTIAGALARALDPEWNRSVIECQINEIDLTGMPPPNYMEAKLNG